MKKRIIHIVAVLLLMAMLTVLIGCVGNHNLVGEYAGTSGSYLKLNQDGTCIYAEDDGTGTGTGTGTWDATGTGTGTWDATGTDTGTWDSTGTGTWDSTGTGTWDATDTQQWQ